MNERITELFCFAVVGDDNVEGVPAFQLHGSAMPLMGADLERMDSLKPIARAREKATGKKVKLYKFSNREELDWK